MRKRQWRVYAKKADFNGLGEKLGISPYTVRIMRNRGLTDEEEMREYISGELTGLHSPHLMKDLDKSAAILMEKIRKGRKIRIIGDYDIDGVCSITVLYKGITALGGVVDWRIPHRIHDGYGLNINMVKDAVDEGDIDTILTCDNGISASEPCRFALEQGLTVIVTDHHSIPPVGNPPANAVVNPHQEGDEYPWPDICGAVVAWKLIQAMYELAGFDSDKYLELIEFAAMATVGDVMPLQGENRLIVRHGLKALHKTHYQGIIQLALASSTSVSELKSYHLGFVIGPALNAGGRLQTAEKSARLLLEDDEMEAMTRAIDLHSINESRKDMTAQALEEAVLEVETTSLKNDRVLVVYLPKCHESLAGIVAGKLREKYYKPCIVLTDGEGGIVKGSARSIEGYHMSDSLSAVSELLLKYGGHPMAAGMSLSRDNVEKFRKALNDNCTLTEEQLTEKCWIDIPLPVSAITLDWLQELDILEPFGNGNEKPAFACANLTLLRVSIIGRNKNVLKLTFREEQGFVFEAMMFHGMDDFLTDLLRNYGTKVKDDLLRGRPDALAPVKMSIMYEPGINVFRDVRSIQIVIRDYHM